MMSPNYKKKIAKTHSTNLTKSCLNLYHQREQQQFQITTLLNSKTRNLNAKKKRLLLTKRLNTNDISSFAKR